MRRRLMCVPMILLCLALSACGGEGGGGNAAEQLALEIRTEYIAMTACTAGMEVTADYGQRVYTYGMDLSWVQEGDTVLTLTAPANVAGATARIREGQTWLEYDGARVETGALSPEGLSPVDAVPALIAYAREGFMAECTEETLGETETVRISCREPDAAAGTGTEAELWFDKATHALLRGEIAVDGFTVIQCVFTGFQSS